jgi:glucose-6-phosphate 1-epimerase
MAFDFPVSLEYVVTLSERELGTGLRVTNHSDKDALQFQALFHNYIRAPADDVKVSPLTGKNYFDKTEATAEAKATPKLEQRKYVDVRKLTDSVYVDGGQEYDVTWSQGGIQIKTEGLKDVVVWNPQETVGKTIGDMEDGGWCVWLVGFQDRLLILPQGEICLRRAWSRSRLHHYCRWRILDWPTGFKEWVVTRLPSVSPNKKKDLPGLVPTVLYH